MIINAIVDCRKWPHVQNALRTVKHYAQIIISYYVGLRIIR